MKIIEANPPKFHNLNDNPGLLPQKLGNAHNVIDYWSFIQIFDITPVIEQFITLQEKYVRLQIKIEKFTENKNEFHNSYNLVRTLEKKITAQISQLNPLNTNRFKRGLIDPLGSLIKVISGNLDQNDAQKYDMTIATLSENQSKMKMIVNNQVTLLQTAIQRFKNTTETLAHNDDILETHIKSIEQILENSNAYKTLGSEYFHIHLVILQILSIFQTIYDVLEKLQVAISFSKLNILHNSLLEPDDLLHGLKSIINHIGKNKLPFSAIPENILYFEKIVKIKAYSKANQLVFIIQIPIVAPKSYNYYRLYPLPTPSIHKFKVIIPTSNYLLLNEQGYIYTEEKCTITKPEEYLCEKHHPGKSIKDSPCEVQMLNYFTQHTNCHQIQTTVNDIKIQQLEDHQWIVITPEEVVATSRCGLTTDNLPINGTYLVEVDTDCEVHIKDFQIKNFQNSSTQFKKITLPQLNTNKYSKSETKLTFSAINLNSVNLNELSNIQSALDIQHQRLSELSDNPIYYNKLSFWTLILYAFLIIACSYIFLRFLQARKKKSQQKKPPEDIII